MDSRSAAEKEGGEAGACSPLDTACSYLLLASSAIELDMSLADTAAPCAGHPKLSSSLEIGTVVAGVDEGTKAA